MDAVLTSLGLDGANATALAVGGAVAATALATALLSGSSGTSKGGPFRAIPSPAGSLPVLGNTVALLMRGDETHDWLTEQTLAFDGEAWRMRILGQPDTIILTLPDAVEEVFVNQIATFPKGYIQTELVGQFFGHGMLASDGERWYHQRKTAAKFFSAKVMRTFLTQAVQKTLGRMSAVLDEAAAKNEPVDLKKMCHNFTLDTFVEMALGVDLNCVSSSATHPFQAALEASSQYVVTRYRKPRWFWRTAKWLDVGDERKFTREAAVMREWLGDVIRQSTTKLTEAQARGETTEIKNVIELFFESSREGAEGIQHDDLVDFMQTFIVAARDTTGDTLSWVFYELARHPQVEAKLRRELKDQFGDRRVDEYLMPDDLRDLVYLDACIKETVRLYPGAPYTYRSVAEDTVICGDLRLQKGELVGFSFYSMARQPRLWGDDAAEWNPDRWIDAATGRVKPLPAHFLSFSSGPRVCIGQNLANLELRAVTANLLHRYTFDVELAPDQSTYAMAATMAMANPLLVRATPHAQKR